jgi:hypothetical protein
MKILVACEYSGRVREAFRAKGHDVTSCDLEPADDNSPHHVQGSVIPLLKERWDMIIAHPPCTYLTNAGVGHLYVGGKGSRQPNLLRWKLLEEGAAFFRLFLEADCDKIAIENPIMHCYGKDLIGRSQDQVIQPWMFGHMEQKATCLWLKGLEPLKPTNNVKAEMMLLPKAQRQRLHYLSPGPLRWKLRSATFPGIADAMSEQWG